jgi:predicted nucleic acid-binding protein
MAQATSVGQSLKRPDAIVAATAIQNGRTVITRDKRFFNFMQAAGYAVQKF